MASSHLDKDMIVGVVQHMNDDHSDACVLITQTLGEMPTAQSAVMTGMDSAGIALMAQMPDGTQQAVNIPFDKPITRDAQIRGHIVALTRKARALQT